MFKNVVYLLLIFCLTVPLSSTPLVDELKEISMQFQLALSEAEKALNDLVKDLEISETALRKSDKELIGLRAECQSLRLEVERLKRVSLESETQKAEFEQQLNSVLQRIEDLKKSFDTYKLKVAKLERQKRFWRTVSLIELAAILIGAAAAARR